MILRTRDTIAGAVTRAILRAEADRGYLIAESAAYKCALIDRGCNGAVICNDASRDYGVMLAGVRSGGREARAILRKKYADLRIKNAEAETSGQMQLALSC